MLEVIIVIAVVKAFLSIAREKGRSTLLWGLIGALSYYVPILLMSFLLLPLMVSAGWLPFITIDNYFICSILINLLTGATCCVVALGTLNCLPSTKEQDVTEDDLAALRSLGRDDGNPYRPNL